MYSETKINEELTKATYDYYTSDLENGSHKKIVVTCTKCNKNIYREYRYAKSKHRCSSIDGFKKRCFKCEEWKDLSFFNKNPKGSGGVAKMCRHCHNSHESVIKAEKRRVSKIRTCFDDGDIDFYIKVRTRQLKHSAKKRNIEFDLDENFMIDLFNKQNGMCYYSNIPMLNKYKSSGFQSWDVPSVDRIDSKKGYTKNNVVWCCFGVNSFKQSLSVDELKNLIQSCNWWFNK